MRDFPTLEIMYYILIDLWHASPLWLVPGVLAAAFMLWSARGSLLEENHTNGSSVAGKIIAITIATGMGCLTFVMVVTLTAMIRHV